MDKSLKLLVLLAPILWCEKALAQRDSLRQTGVEFGLHNSINFTHLSGTGGPIVYSNRIEYYEPIRNRVTFDLGMFAVVHLSKSIALQPEVAYSYMGGHFQKTTTYLHDLGAFEGTENVSFAADYIKAALAANIKFNERVFFQVGGYGSSLLSAERFVPWWEVNTENDRTQLTGVRGFDAGVLGGFGLSTNVVNMTFRYNYGLLDIFESGDFSEFNMRNGVFQFVLQWKFYSDLR
ncbi:MAG: porin family protein [Reichenbachiella sp.]|uniref:porin family protein n=1 Tax=Reichenbachiella sp. TaxID=2184521 RepID=UPI002966D40D|nr:porin family protein [Reichenbachiella sp.]MDW3208503.1 porin family protein [Reichenbachiella sp.]